MKLKYVSRERLKKLRCENPRNLERHLPMVENAENNTKPHVGNAQDHRKLHLEGVRESQLVLRKSPNLTVSVGSMTQTGSIPST